MTLSGRLTLRLIDSNSEPTRFVPTEFTLESTRPLALPKGLPKQIAGSLFLPENSTGRLLDISLQSLDSGLEKQLNSPILQKMPSYQYYLVVLSKEPSRYGYLKVADTIKAPWEEETEEKPDAHYRVVLADATKNIPLPESLFHWTSVAYVFWDEVDPESLSLEQQDALVDWLHWGGRLIVNGPDSLDILRGSFLDPYLPVEKVGTRTFDAEALRSWASYWSQRTKGRDSPELVPLRPWSGVELKPKSQAREIVGGDRLFYEGGVGLGSIVVSAVQLSEREFVNWPGFDGFLNGGLLKRPRRMFTTGPYGGVCSTWGDFEDRRLDAHFTTGLRLFSRDTSTKANVQVVTSSSANNFGIYSDTETVNIDRPGGIGAWNAFGPGATVARESLQSAAAVQIPGPGFVLGCLAVYLLVLVPLNWMLFKSLGRVEWAWISAPLIALLGTVAIVRQAQLDIGFVRSETEIALLELQGEHDRGLLSRYTGLYSSLSTTYDITYDNPTAFATPFPDKAGDDYRVGDRIWNLRFEKQKQSKLSGLAISSASTRMVQSEEMFELDGPLRIGKSSLGHKQLENKTGYKLRDLVLIHRSFDATGNPRYKGTWIGELRSGDSSVLGLTPMTLSKEQLPFHEERQEAAKSSFRQQIDLDALLRLAFQFPGMADPMHAKQEEIRVVGLIEQAMPGVEVSPKSSQIQGATLVLAHLDYGELPLPLPDINSPKDVSSKKQSNLPLNFYD